MKYTICTLLAMGSAAFAGTSMVASSGKGKSAPPPMEAAACPDFLTYNEVQLSYVHLDADSEGTADGVDIRIIKELTKGVFGYGDLSKVDGDVEGTSLDLGLGAYVPLCKAFQLVGRGGYSYFDGGDADSHGWHVAGGFRTQIACNLELNGKIQYGDLVDFEEGTYWSYGVGATYHLNETVAVVTEYVFGEGETWSIRGGLAYKF